MKKIALLFSLTGLALLYETGMRAQVMIGLEVLGNCEPAAVNLHNSSNILITGTAVWEWDINGEIYNDYELIGMQWPAGTYNVTLSLYDSLGFEGSDYNYFEVYPNPGTFMITSDGQACPGETLEFWVDDQVSYYYLEWIFGDNSVPIDDRFSNHSKHTFYETGTFDVTLILDHFCGSDTLVRQVTVGSSAQPAADGWLVNGPEFCPSDPVIFDFSGDYPSWTWDFGDGKTASEKSPTHVYPAEGPATYYATLTVTNACGNTDTDTVQVDFVSDKQAEADIQVYFNSLSAYPCPSMPVNFETSASGIYEWDFGDGTYASGQKVVNYYTEPGLYYVTLKVWNGCGSAAVATDSIQVMGNPSDMPYADFTFALENWNQEEVQGDTLRACPGIPVAFRNLSSSYGSSDMSFVWDFGDGSQAFSKQAVHTYFTPSASPYPVTLTVTNSCGGSGSVTHYVMVDAGLQPNVSLGVVPDLICDGERVFFYLDDDLRPGQYVFDVDFGDGQTLNGATGYSDPVLRTIANHPYTGAAGSTFDYTFTVTNQCGNSLDKTGTITITNDAGLKPFYYVENSTSQGGGGTQMEDWSVRQSPDDHEFVIHFAWPIWPGGQDNFAVFFWYGGFYPEGDMGPANGFVEFKTSKAVMGDSVRVYIPIDPLNPPSVGFAVGWSCDGTYPQGVEPEVWGTQLDFGGLPVYDFPLIPGGLTDMNTIGDPVILDMSWDGLCNNEKPGRNYYSQLNAGQFLQLSLDPDYNQYDLWATSDQSGNEYLSDLSYGDYSMVNSDTLMFTGWGSCTGISGTYRYALNGDQMDLFVISDDCSERVKYLTGNTFIRKADFGDGDLMAGCPGDKVLFKVAGGTSWEWHFGDGTPVSTLPYPVHAYSAPGTYDAFVIGTNSCGRQDTIHTPVKISAGGSPPAYFSLDTWEFPRLEPVQFNYSYTGLDQAGNYTYLWDFGDGNTSDLMNPVHAFQKIGQYTVKLTVSNGCGSSTQEQGITVHEIRTECEAKIGIDSIVGRKVYLRDVSRGEITDWFWDFGDGFTSSLQNPVYTYDYDGPFLVCLSVFDSISNCSHQACRQVDIGTRMCAANFMAQANDATLKVQFTDLSDNPGEWFWDFGDGSFSSLQNPVHSYNAPGRYEVCLSVYNSAADCFANFCKEVQVGQQDVQICFADFTYFVDESSNSVIFTDASSDNITNWYWTFGDGSFATDRNPVKTYKQAGVYQVTLIVFDSNTGCAKTRSVKVPVGVPLCNLQADFVYFLDEANSEVTFSDRTGGKPAKWFWDFGDGSTSSARNPKHKYQKPGLYLVSLCVRDENNLCTDHRPELIQLGSPDCVSSFEFKVDPDTRNVQFYNMSRGTLAEYFWDFDDGSSSDEKDPRHMFEKPGLYFVSLTVLNSDGLCMDLNVQPVQVGGLDCAARFVYFVDSASNTAYFTPEAVGSASAYLWFFGDGAVSTARNAMHRFSQPGYYTVGLNTYDVTTGCMDYFEEVILIGRAGQDCRASFTYMSDPVNLKVKFGNRSRGEFAGYLWNFGDLSTSTEKDPVHNYAAEGRYMVCLTAVNTDGIPNTYCEVVPLATTDAEKCFAEFFFNADSASRTVDFVQEARGNPDEFNWDFGDGETSDLQNPEHTYSEAGYYLVGLKIRNSSTSCIHRRYKLVNVAKGNQGLRASFAYEIDSSDLKADTYPVDFIGVSLGDAGKLKWDFGDGSTDTTTLNPTHYYQQPGKYTACLTVSNPNTGDQNTYCQEVTTPGYVGTGPDLNWDHNLAIYPNPFGDRTNIAYDLASGGFVELVLFDQTGRMVDILVRQNQAGGHYHMEYDGSGLSNGIYTLRLSTDSGITTARMVVY